ncbi:MAG: nucleotidyltransferase domain-containing protein [Gammaproteobacteria bacterium]|nr:nucleotidyltransferase domain-containing protein [Gammaproteobacteria bacterium]
MRTTPPSADLAALFFGAYRRQVLSLLLLHPGESLHLREIARVTHTQPGTLRRELAQLTKAGVLSREKLGNLIRYKADPACPIYDELRGILKKTAGVADVLRAGLASLSGKISVAFVYGSIASGAERRASDIDIMVVGSASFEEVVRALHASQDELRREINPNVYSTAEFKKKAKEKGGFLSRVLGEPKLFILGTENDLRKLGANRKVKAA